MGHVKNIPSPLSSIIIPLGRIYLIIRRIVIGEKGSAYYVALWEVSRIKYSSGDRSLVVVDSFGSVVIHDVLEFKDIIPSEIMSGVGCALVVRRYDTVHWKIPLLLRGSLITYLYRLVYYSILHCMGGYEDNSPPAILSSLFHRIPTHPCS